MKKILLTILALFTFSQASIAPVSAGMLPHNWDQKVQEAADFVTPEDKNGLEIFQELVIDNIAQIFRYLLISIVMVYIFSDLIILILGSSDESIIEKIKGNMGYYALGLLLFGLSSEMVRIFDVAHLNGQVGNVAQAKTMLQYIINYISLFAGAIATFFMLIAAMRMITAQGDESVIDAEKNDFAYGFIGLIVIIMADVMINQVFYPADIQAPGEQETLTFAQEIFSMTKYFLEFMAIVAIGFLVLAGGYYVMASFNDEGDIDTAKTILKNVAIGFIMISFAYTVVSAVAPNVLGQVVAG